MSRKGIIEPNQIEWASTCVLIEKPEKDDEILYEQQKGKFTKRDPCPIPRINDCIDRIGNSKYITKCDQLKTYWAVMW